MLLASLLAPWLLQGQTSAPAVNTGAPPPWVEVSPQDNNGPLPPNSESHGSFLILFEQQINAATSEKYVHVIKRINNESGVQNGANLSFAFDPSFQKLVVHQIVIHRNDQSIERLDPAKFKIIQQEADLDRQIYNGTLSAVLFLEDVRVGDRIEYAYTLSGEDPGWRGQYAEVFLAAWPIPVQHLRHRVLWPRDRELFFKSFGISAAPQIKTSDHHREYVWDWRDVPAVAFEDQVPSWYPAYPFVQISSFKDWAEVSAWATGLFAGTNLDAPELTVQTGELKHPDATAEQSIQGALDFVQTSIRYLGIELGENSFRPTDPATVLHRRFGDCKDKAFLLCTLLHGLGFEATPVLVATGYRQTLPDLLPAPNDFNHAIVRVATGQKTYWVDPTAGYQRGPLAGRYLPAYTFGLLTRPGEKDLTPIPAAAGGWPEAFTLEEFRVSGQKSPATLTVTSTYNGCDAEWMRAVLASAGQETLAKSYLNDYAQFYPGTISRAPLILIDKNTNSLTLIHQYLITNFWSLSADKLRYVCRFYPLGIHSWITKPETVNRSLPLELSFPRQRTVETRIYLPREFKLSNVTNIFRGPAAELYVQRHVTPRTVDLKYIYRSLTNQVPASLTPAHLKSLDEMENAINYSLTWQNLDGTGGHRFNWPVFLLAVFYALVCAVALVMLYRHQSRAPRSEPVPAADPQLVGLGGWLILVGISLFVGPLRIISLIIRYSNSFSGYTWQALTTPGGTGYSPVWAPLLCFELLGQMTLFALAVFALVLFFQKRRAFPKWFIILIVANAVFSMVDVAAVHGLIKSPPSAGASTSEQRAFFQILIGLCIWIPYMCISKRVRATFTR
ncbi:MAG: DUF3857 domain-containing protein [Verrucomicrobiae bacterium]|nr:DUF3857 domain-containing protein [Verrucomicrobiae bacterium]